MKTRSCVTRSLRPIRSCRSSVIRQTATADVASAPASRRGLLGAAAVLLLAADSGRHSCHQPQACKTAQPTHAVPCDVCWLRFCGFILCAGPSRAEDAQIEVIADEAGFGQHPVRQGDLVLLHYTGEVPTATAQRKHPLTSLSPTGAHAATHVHVSGAAQGPCQTARCLTRHRLTTSATATAVLACSALWSCA